MLLRHSFVVLALALLGCGSSASETPWPAEPEGKLLGPAGELEKPEEGRPTAVADAGPNVEP
jgi:hypothetical protein